jgi:hypothetical protein
MSKNPRCRHGKPNVQRAETPMTTGRIGCFKKLAVEMLMCVTMRLEAKLHGADFFPH